MKIQWLRVSIGRYQNREGLAATNSENRPALSEKMGFYLHVSGVSHVASETVERVAKLWAVEEKVRGQDPDCRRTARQEQSAAIVAELWPFWERDVGRISGKSNLAEAIRYARSSREALERFLHDGRLDIDFNAVEPAIRPPTITRRMPSSPVSDGGGGHGRPSQRFYTAEMVTVFDPSPGHENARRIANGWPNRDLDQLMSGIITQTERPRRALTKNHTRPERDDKGNPVT